MLGNLSGWHLVVILFIILLLFGAPKLPGLAKSLGQSMKILKKEVSTPHDEADAAKAADGASTEGTASAKSAAPSDAELAQLKAEAAQAKADAAAAKAEAEALRQAAQQSANKSAD